MDLLKSFSSRARLEAFDEDDTPSTFTDTVSAAFAQVRREELIDSSLRAFRSGNTKRSDVIADLGGDAGLARDYELLHRSIEMP